MINTECKRFFGLNVHQYLRTKICVGDARPTNTKIGVAILSEHLLKLKRIAELALIAFESFRKICRGSSFVSPHRTDC